MHTRRAKKFKRALVDLLQRSLEAERMRNAQLAIKMASRFNNAYPHDPALHEGYRRASDDFFQRLLQHNDGLE